MCIGADLIPNAVVDHTQSTRGCMRRKVDIVNMQHPPWWENTTTIITQRRIEVCLEKVVNNTENEKYNASFYLTGCSPYEDESNRSLTSLLSAMIETLGRKHDNRTICSPRDVTYYNATSGYICHLDLGYQL